MNKINHSKLIRALIMIPVLLLAAATTAADFRTWTYRLEIRFAGYTRPETLTNFPALVVLSPDITGFHYADFASPDGADLRFSRADWKTELNYEIEQWNTNGASYVWVQIPSLVDSNTIIRAFWGKPGVTAPDYTTNGFVWDPDYMGIWHLNDTPDNTAGGIRNSVSNPAHASSYNMEPADLVPGVSGNALDFDGVNEYARATLSAVGLTRLTVSFWAQPDQNTSGQRGLFQWADVISSTGPFFLYVKNTSSTNTRLYVDGSYRITYPIPNQAWSHVAVTLDSSNLWTVWIDGAQAGTWQDDASHMNQAKGTVVWFANGYNGYFDGKLDEIRISGVARSADWIWACSMSQASNTLFNTYGKVVKLSNTTIFKGR